MTGSLLLLLTAATATCLIPGLSSADVNKVLGESVSFRAQFTGDPTLINWTFQKNKLVDLTKNADPEYYGQWKDRATANMSGYLTIHELRYNDSGQYRAEVIVHDPIQATEFQLTVHAPVTAPVIRNTPQGGNITLHCNCSTPNVTYQWLDSEGKEISTGDTVTIERTAGQEATNMTCVVRNPASQNSSTVILPATRETTDMRRSHNWVYVALGLFSGGLVVRGIVFFVMKRRRNAGKTREQENRETNMETNEQQQPLTSNCTDEVKNLEENQNKTNTQEQQESNEEKSDL